MSFAYTPYKANILKALVDHDAPNDFRVLLLKVAGSTTADTDQDAATISAITTLGEIVATGYARQALTGETVNQDDPNNRGEFDANDAAFGALGGATNDTIGAIMVFKFVTDDTDNQPMAYIDGAIFPGSASSMTTNGSTVTIAWNAEGIIQTT